LSNLIYKPWHEKKEYPCFELWLLLHAKDQKSSISSDAVVKELRKSADVWKDYSKSKFPRAQQVFLEENLSKAIARAKKLKLYQNPSTSIYKLIEMLESKR